MSIRISSETNPGKPSVYERCGSDVEGDYLERETGSRSQNNLRSLLENRRIYETRDMPVINFEEDRN